MSVTIHPVLDKDLVSETFSMLYDSSEPYMNADSNPWAAITVVPGDDAALKKTLITNAFFSALQITDPSQGTGAIVEVDVNGVPASMFSGVVKDNIYHIYWAVYNNINGSRAWLYDSAIMNDHLLGLKTHFENLGVIGYTVTAPYGSTLYNYHKLNKPVLGLHSSITEEDHPDFPSFAVITYLF